MFLHLQQPVLKIAMLIDVETEIRDIDRRNTGFADSFDLLRRQIGELHNDLLGFAAKTERWFDRFDQRFDQINLRFDGLDRKIDLVGDGLAKELRRIVGDAVRDALRDCDKKG